MIKYLEHIKNNVEYILYNLNANGYYYSGLANGRLIILDPPKSIIFYKENAHYNFVEYPAFLSAMKYMNKFIRSSKLLEILK